MNEEILNDELLTIPEVLAILKISKKNFWKHAKRNNIKKKYIGSSVRYPKSELTKLITDTPR